VLLFLLVFGFGHANRAPSRGGARHYALLMRWDVGGRSAVRGVVGALLALGLALSFPAAAQADIGAVKIGAKNFSGAELLSQLYGQALAAKGAQITFLPDVGPTEASFEQLEQGAFDGYGEYQGTLLEFLGGRPNNSSARTHTALEAKLSAQGFVVSKPAPAVDVNGFYVMRKTAARFDLTRVSDLKKIARKLKIGGPPECLERPLCLGSSSQKLYGLQFANVLKLDAGGPETRAALKSGRIDVGVLFTGSSVIPKDAVLLRDDKGLQPADNPVMVLRKDAATPEVLDVVNAVSAEVTTEAYRKMSLEVSVNHHDPADVAATFLADNDLP
jgi:osmoprotectant transport system substrate-binding protein